MKMVDFNAFFSFSNVFHSISLSIPFHLRVRPELGLLPQAHVGAQTLSNDEREGRPRAGAFLPLKVMTSPWNGNILPYVSNFPLRCCFVLRRERVHGKDGLQTAKGESSPRSGRRIVVVERGERKIAPEAQRKAFLPNRQSAYLDEWTKQRPLKTTKGRQDENAPGKGKSPFQGKGLVGEPASIARNFPF